VLEYKENQIPFPNRTNSQSTNLNPNNNTIPSYQYRPPVTSVIEDDYNFTPVPNVFERKRKEEEAILHMDLNKCPEVTTIQKFEY